MNSNESRCIITKSVNLKNNFKSPLQRQYPDSPVCGGTFSDFELTWLYNGPLLRIFDAATGTLTSAWDFTTVTHDNRTEITSVIEYYIPESNRSSMKENQLHFIVSYTSKKDPSKASYISLCHPRTSRVLHTITTREKVTCLSLITARKDHSSPIAGIVKLMCGALAAGTTSGNLLIVDIKELFTWARQGCVDRMQNRFSEMVIVELKHNENNIKEKLNKTDEFHHVAVSLPMTDRKEHEDGDLRITALTYIPQCTMLAVGLKNGAFQLWDVSTLKRLHRSSVSSGSTSVVKFGFQEPCNDPQSFCYLWVLYESQAAQNDVLPFAIMYACLFKKIITVPDYGIHYRNLVHCKKRFDLDIDMERSISGRCIACSVVSNTPSNILRHVTSVAEEDASKINLFVIIFETWEQLSDCNSCISLIIFDMNQWYKAQMPQLVYQGGSVQFVNFQVLEHLSERKNTVVDMRIKKDTIQQFLSFNLSEEYSYPSSLSFDMLVLTDSKLIHARLPGAQRNVLDKIVSEGPSGIINPNKYFSECKVVGLLPYFSDRSNNLFAPSQVQQRNFILTLLLEHKFSSFLVSCVKQWADGSRGVSGCTLPNLIRWAWDCVTLIKKSTDDVCVPLFDYSGDDLDRENYQKLKHCVQLLHTIKDLLTYILKNYRQYLLEEVKLKHQVDALKLITTYFDTIIWCLDCNLLPEKVTSSSEKCVPTYMMNLMQYSEQRREELRNIVATNQYFVTESTSLYIIDSILENDPTGKKMRAQWERESNGLSNGSYPPVTLQSLLRMFLLPGLSNDSKNFIMIYFLLDVCDYHRDEDMKEQLLSFSVVFSIDSAFFSLVQACWFVDHEKFDDASCLLLNDAVISQLKNRRELYRTLMLACVCQGQCQLALRIEKLTKLSRTVFNDDTFSVTVLLLNGLVMDAYFTLKENPVKQKELLRHFFRVCDNLGYLKEIFKFPLSPVEEEEFMNYLGSCGSKDAGDLKVMYLLSRGRYVEAIDVNHQLASTVPKFDVVGQDTTTQKIGVGRTTTRDILVNAFGKTLPVVTNDLINFCRKERSKIARFRTVAKPTPLSVVVHTDTSHRIPVYKSSFESVMEAAICKTAETWTNVPEILKRKRGQLDLKNAPFLRSNFITPRKNVSLYSERETFSTREENKSVDVDEPPTKRARKSIFAIDNIPVDESLTNKDTTTLSTLVETSNILCTPHVQKRLNKLLQNTPESSPLTSILKSVDSPSKQPQKVGFNVPVTDVRYLKRLGLSQSRSLPKTTEENNIMKCDAERTLESQANRSVSRERRSFSTSNSKSSNSSPASTAQDSFYSLDSESDGICDVTDFVQEQSVLPVMSQFSVEAMSEDETPPRGRISSKMIIECMSEGETSSFNASKSISDSLSEEKILQRGQASTFTIENMSEESISLTDRTVTFVSEHSTKGNLIESTRTKDEALPPTRLQFDETISKPQTIQVEVHAPPSTFTTNEPEVDKEASSFTALQPLQDSSEYEITDRSSETGCREEFSIEMYEKETVLEQHSQELDNESDSDIEIVEESFPRKDVERDDSNSCSSNDNLSEKSYESDYSASQNSVRTGSDVLDEDDESQDVEAAEETVEREEDVEEEEEEEDEVSIQGEEEAEDEEVPEESFEVRDSSDEEVDNQDDEELGHVDEEEVDNEDDEENIEKFSDNQLDIDYDSLKEIMSTVNANLTNQIESVDSEMPSDDPSLSMLCNETMASVYEVVCTVPSDTSTTETTRTSSVLAEQEEAKINADADENQSNRSVETLSVTNTQKDPAVNEPQLVFYFGENSVSSISEKLVNDESINQSQYEVAVHGTDESQKTRDFSIVAMTEEDNVETDNCTDSDKVENPLLKSGSWNANVIEESFDENTERTEDISIVNVSEEHEVELTYETMDMSHAANVSTIREQQTEDYSILAVTEECNESFEEVKSASEAFCVPGGAREDLCETQNDEIENTENFSLVGVTLEQTNIEEEQRDIESTSEIREAPLIVEGDVENINIRFGEEQPNIEVDMANKRSECEWTLTQSQNVSIGLVEEMVGDTTQTEDSTIRLDEAEGAELSDGEIPSSNSSREGISIGIAEEIVGMQSSGNSSVLIKPPQTARMTRARAEKSNLRVMEDSTQAEPGPESNALDTKPTRSSTRLRTRTSQYGVHDEGTTHYSSAARGTSEERSPTKTPSVPVQDAAKVITSPQSHSDRTDESADSHTVLPPAIRENEIVQTSRLQSSPPEKESAPMTPVKKAESECSFTMSIPDSPTGMLEPSTPSRRSLRLARRQSTESIPPVVAAEAVSTTTRATRRSSTDSANPASDVSVAESVTSGTSKSGTRKRSFSKLEMRKSSVKPQFKKLKVIKSDEELSDTNSGVTDDDRASTSSKASSISRRSNRRASSSKLNTAILQTPSPPLKKRMLRDYVSATSETSPKTKPDGDYENYTDSRRLTRSQQKSLLEYGVTRVPISVESPAHVSDAEQGNLQVDETVAKSTSRTRMSSRQMTTETSQKREDDRGSKSGKPAKRDKVLVQANSDSSDDSSYSRASTASSRRAKSGRLSTRTGTHLELRKSSVRPQFKPLTVIPSDEESVSHSIADDEPSSQTSSTGGRSRTTRSTKRTQKNESEQSDADRESISGSPRTSLTTRRTRRSLAVEETAKPTVPSQKRRK